MRLIAMSGACALLVVGLAILGPACMGTVDSASEETAEPVENMTPNEEPVGEAAQGLAVCECSTASDFCSWTVGGKCVAGFTKCTPTPKWGCGAGGLYPCTGWCVRP
jgi:hypothetical protein